MKGSIKNTITSHTSMVYFEGGKMYLESLRYFLEVLRAESFTRAANNVFISQQGLSKAIHTLEGELQVSLLERGDNGKTVPTEAGREFSEAAHEILALWEATLGRMALYSASGSLGEGFGRTTVLASPYVANLLSFLFDSREYRKDYSSGEELVVKERSFGKICKELQDSPADTVALVNVASSVLEERNKEDMEFAFETLLNMNIMIKCSASFFNKKKKSISLKELRSLPLALYDDPMLSLILRPLVGPEDECNIRLHTTNKREMNNAVMRGEMATFTDTFAESVFNQASGEKATPDDLIRIPIQSAPCFMVGFLTVKGAKRSPACLQYEAFCKRYLNARYHLYMKRHPL